MVKKMNNMSADVMKIKCPNCGAVLVLKNGTNLEGKKLKCAACKETAPYHLFKPVVYRQEEHTEYPEEYGTPDSSENSARSNNYTLGQIRILSSDLPVFRLKVGKNVIGRKANVSTADIQIPMGENKRLSREHLVIEIKKIPERGFVHYASLYKLKSNATFINESLLEYGDCAVLQNGDVIKLPDVSIRFEIPDEDETEI